MRPHSAQDDAVFLAGGQSTWIRASVKDAGGTLRDLTSLPGGSYLDGVELKESIDSNSIECVLTVRRAIFANSLAPDVAGSQLNTIYASAPLIDLNREVKVEAQIRAAGIGAPDPNGWKEVFYGRIEKFDAGPDPMRLECRDLGSRLETRQIKVERAYGVWQPARRYINGRVVIATTDVSATPNAYWSFTAAAGGAGTSGATEPAWPVAPTAGTTIADNGNTWTAVAAASGGTPMETQIQELLDDNLATPGAVSLYTPTSPTFLIRDYNQRKESIFSALKTLAALVGADLRFRYDASDLLRLTLLTVNRAAIASVYSLPASKYQEITSYPKDLSFIRNYIEVSFYDPTSTALDTSGNPKASSVTSQDAASIAAYDELYMGIAEGAGSQISSPAQAQAMADAIRSDLAQPLVALPVRMEFEWWLQLGDLVTLKKDGIHADVDQVMAIATITRSFKVGEPAWTELGLRQKPASGHRTWHDSGAFPGLNGGPVRNLGPRAPATLAEVGTIAGGTITFHLPAQRERYDFTELHIGTPGFTPSSATLKAISRGGRFDLTGLTAGTSYTYRLAHRDTRGNLSPYSPERSFTAAYVTGASLTPGMTVTAEITRSSADANSGADSAPVAFDTQTFNTGCTVSLANGSITPNSSTLAKVSACVTIRSGTVATIVTIDSSCRAQLTLYAAGTAIARSKWTRAEDASDGVAEITMTLERTIQAVATRALTLGIQVVNGAGTLVTVGTTNKVTLKAASATSAGCWLSIAPSPL